MRIVLEDEHHTVSIEEKSGKESVTLIEALELVKGALQALGFTLDGNIDVISEE